MTMIHFGPWSVLLAIGAGFGTAVALLLLLARTNRVANALLAGLIVVIVLKLGPYILGFAGFYDAYPWLSFAPFPLGMAMGPLLYLYVLRLTRDALPAGWQWHLLLGAMQLLYRVIVFVQPLPAKNRWNDAVHAPFIDPAETFLQLASMVAYLWAAVRAWRDYQRWLDGHLSNREEFRQPWLRNFLVAFSLLLPVWIGFEIASYGIGFDYYQRFPLYVAFTGLVFYLGLEGWRHAAIQYPLPATAPPPVEAVTPGRDWPAQGLQWQARLLEAQWWRDPDLTLDRLARHLGTNTAYLSRALNDGLGMNFNEVVNRLRVEEVARRLQINPPQDLLTIAFEAGFSSKTSFNRVFKHYMGETPSRARARLGEIRPKS